MASKLLCSPCRNPAKWFLAAQSAPETKYRCISLIPRTHYDAPFPRRLNLAYALRVYWEICPVVAVTTFALSCMIGSIVWALSNKVDVVFSSHNRSTISRTMNLRKPTCHKLITIDQKYEPWPEMAELYDKMHAAENQVSHSVDYCAT